MTAISLAARATVLLPKLIAINTDPGLPAPDRADAIDEAISILRALLREVATPAPTGRTSPVTQEEMDDCYGQGAAAPSPAVGEAADIAHSHYWRLISNGFKCESCGLMLADTEGTDDKIAGWVDYLCRKNIFPELTWASIMQRQAALLERQARALREITAPAVDACDHQWVDARNEFVQSGELCLKCHAVRATPYVPGVTCYGPSEGPLGDGPVPAPSPQAATGEKTG